MTRILEEGVVPAAVKQHQRPASSASLAFPSLPPSPGPGADRDPHEEARPG